MKRNSIKGIAFLGTLITFSVLSANAQTINRQLQFGMSGSDVGVLQAFLARNFSIYPEGKITNYFGALTRAAVVRFQALNGISAIGRVGPMTLAAINAQMLSMGGTTPSPTSPGAQPIKNVSVVNNGGGRVTLSWATAKPTKATIYYSTSPLTTYEGDNMVTISGQSMTSNSFQMTDSMQLSGLSSNTTYYYTIYTINSDDGTVNMTWPTTFVTSQ